MIASLFTAVGLPVKMFASILLDFSRVKNFIQNQAAEAGSTYLRALMTYRDKAISFPHYYLERETSVQMGTGPSGQIWAAFAWGDSGQLPESHFYLLTAASILAVWRSPSCPACLQIVEIRSAGVLAGGMWKALVEGGRKGAAVPGAACCAVGPAGQGVMPLRAQVLRRLSHLSAEPMKLRIILI